MNQQYAHSPENTFPKNFRKVIKFETIYVNNRPVICAYVLNLLEKTNSVMLELVMVMANIPFVSLRSIRGQGREEEACCATDDSCLCPSFMFQQLGICVCQWKVQQ